MVIDAHVHLPVVTGNSTYEASRNQLLRDMKADRVDRAVLIPDNVAGSSIGDLPTCLELVANCPQLLLLGTVDPRQRVPEQVAELRRLASTRRIVGAKLFPGHDPVYPTDPVLAPVYELCDDCGMPVVIHTGANVGQPEAAQFNDPRYIVQIAERYPSLTIVMAHLFWPEVECCYALTHACRTIHYDLSALADDEVVAATGRERIESVLRRLVAESPERVIFGTDYAMCSRQAHFELIERLGIGIAARDRVLWRNAARVFGLTGVAP